MALSPDGKRIFILECSSSGKVDCASASIAEVNPFDPIPIQTIDLGRGGATGLGMSPDGKTLYVTDEATLTPDLAAPGIAFVDPETKEISRFVPLPRSSPEGIVVAPSGSLAYVRDSDFSSVYAIDLSGGKKIASIPLPSPPTALAISSDGATLYAAGRSVFAISTAANQVVSRSFIDYETRGIALAPDGSKCYIADYYESAVAVLDLNQGRVIARVPAGFRPVAVSLTPDGLTSFVANSGSSTITQVDESVDAITGKSEAGAEPVAVAVHPNGSFVYAINLFSSNVSVISTVTLERVTNIPVGYSPITCAIAPDGIRLYVSTLGGTIDVIDTSLNQVVGRIPVAPGGSTLAYGLAVGPTGKRLYALTDFGAFRGILVIDTVRQKITARIPLVGDIAQIAISPDEKDAYVVGNSNQGFLIVVDLVHLCQVDPILVYKPFGVAISPDGKFIYTGTTDHPSIVVIDRARGKVVSATPVAGTAGISLSSNGRRLYVTGPVLTVYDTVSRAIVATLDTGGPTTAVVGQ
jgi:YVTN family beta-propeller protein